MGRTDRARRPASRRNNADYREKIRSALQLLCGREGRPLPERLESSLQRGGWGCCRSTTKERRLFADGARRELEQRLQSDQYDRLFRIAGRHVRRQRPGDDGRRLLLELDLRRYADLSCILSLSGDVFWYRQRITNTQACPSVASKTKDVPEPEPEPEPTETVKDYDGNEYPS